MKEETKERLRNGNRVILLPPFFSPKVCVFTHR